MKKAEKTLLTAFMLMIGSFTVSAQYDWQEPPKPTENVLGVVTFNCPSGIRFKADKDSPNPDRNEQYTRSIEELYEVLLDVAHKKYGYENISLRNFNVSGTYEESNYLSSVGGTFYTKYYKVAAAVIGPAKTKTINALQEEGDLTKALGKALQDIRDGSRIAIDQVRVPSDVNKEEYKDEVVEILLDKGYKVVAKEYLEKLYEEQQAQQSGIYNDRTTVKDNNFSAVGYYLNVRLTETSLRVQIINVSTGEYDANVTIKF